MSNEKAAASGGQQHEIVYNQTLGFWDLFFIAVGTIIGSGVMVMTGRAIAMTGRSVAFAYIGAAIWVICMGVPTILMTSCIRLNGGAYTQFNLFVSEKLGGFYMAIQLLSQMGMNLYAQTFARYFCELFKMDLSMEKPVAAVCIISFFIVNFFGVDAMAKLQNFMSSILLIVLFWFTVRGFPKIQPGFFSQPGFMTEGWKGLFAASTLLTYALLGGTSVMPYSAFAKQPKRDLPVAAASSTLIIAVLFALMGAVCSGILPLEQVSNQSLSLVADFVLTKPEYVAFMVGGALFAAATTLNSVIGSASAPFVMMSYDGWLPKSMCDLHPKYNTPWKWLIFWFVVTMLPLILNFDISQVTDLTLLGSYTMTTINIWGLLKLPKKFPKQWEESMFHMPNGVFYVLMVICFAASLTNVWGMVSSSDFRSIAINVGLMAVGLAFSFIRWGSGKVAPSQSWSDV